MRVMHRQQKAVVEPLANLPGQPLDDGKVEDQLILVERAFHLDQHAIVMPVQTFAFPAESDEVGRAKLEVAALHFHFAQDLFIAHGFAPSISSHQTIHAYYYIIRARSQNIYLRSCVCYTTDTF